MIRTRVGYTGGRKLSPTYHSLGDHTESLQIDFDPARISYEKLLEIFWASHRPEDRAWSVQYRNAVFYQDDEQRRLAERSRDELARRTGTEIHTAIEPLGTFYPAEDYHQKWTLRRRGGAWLAWLQQLYPQPEAFRDSTAATRLNGYFGGHLDGVDRATLEAELGLTAEASRVLAKELGVPTTQSSDAATPPRSSPTPGSSCPIPSSGHS